MSGYKFHLYLVLVFILQNSTKCLQMKSCRDLNKTELQKMWTVNNTKSRVFCQELCSEMATCPGYEYARTCKLLKTEDRNTKTVYRPLRNTSLEYKFHRTSLNWSEALAVCQREDATLIEPQPHKVFEPFFARIIKKGMRDVWIGLVDKYDNDVWMWNSGKLSEPTHWYVGEPDNINMNRKENCAVMSLDKYFNLGFRWCDYSCSRRIFFVCTRKNKNLA